MSLDHQAVLIGLQTGRYTLADAHVRAALRELHFGRRRSAADVTHSIRFRAEPTGGEGVLVGYATVWGVTYPVGGGLREQIARGAFAASLAAQGGVIPTFYEHDWSQPLGWAQASEDATGLRVEARLLIDENEKARSVWRAAQAGALKEWSIGYRPETITLSDSEAGPVEIVEVAELIEASVVVRGANPATSMVNVRREAS